MNNLKEKKKLNLNIDLRIFNKKYIPLLHDDTYTQIMFGGSSSGKSVFLAQRAVLDVLNGRNYLIVRNTGSTLKKSTFNEIKKAIIQFKLEKFFTTNISDLIITCKLNKRQIIFAGLDDPEKIKSITPINGVITDIWIEEATETQFKAVKQLYKRLRGFSKHKKRLTLSFNPILQTHWIYKEYFKKWDDKAKFYKDDKLLIIHSTYLDNKFLTKGDKQALENETDQYFYNVYTLGLWGILGNLIFKNWEMQDLSDIKDSFSNIKNGLDFGYSSDPSALVKTHYDKKKKIIYITNEVYQKELDNEQLAKVIKPLINNKVVTCDCSEPKSIKELKKYKIFAIGAKKGPDSVDFGIKFLQKHKIIIDINCQNFKNEISQYKWKEDKEGNVLPIPVGKDDHLLDALRYAYEDEMDNTEAIIF